MSSKYLIILVNYVNWQDTFECIESLKNCGINDSHILVIDNHSPNDSFNKLNEAFPSINIFQMEKNLGFTGANNFGIKYAADNMFDFAVLLNNDTVVESPDSIQILIDEMTKHTDATLGTGRIFYFSDKNKIWYDGGKIIKWRGMAVHLNYGKKKSNVDLSNKLKNVDFISGCFMCIRLRDIFKLGFLHEDFFMYLDDVEFCSRALKKSLKLLYIPESVIYHKAKGEEERTHKRIYYSIRNRKLLINLHFGIISKFYFSIVLLIKRSVWFFTNKQHYKLLSYAMRDYNNKYFGQAQEYIK